MHIDATIDLPVESTLFGRNPEAKSNGTTYPVKTAMMGDIIQTSAESAKLSIDVKAHAGIQRIEIRNGKQVLQTIRPYEAKDLGNRIRI